MCKTNLLRYFKNLKNQVESTLTAVSLILYSLFK